MILNDTQDPRPLHNGPRDPQTGDALPPTALVVGKAVPAAGPGIPGDDIPLTAQENEEFEALAEKLTSAPGAPRFTYTPPPVAGYRALSQVEVDLMNQIKAKGGELQQLILQVQGHLLMQRRDAARLTPIQASDDELRRIDRAEPDRWARISNTHLQEGLMALTRAVAQPSNF